MAASPGVSQWVKWSRLVSELDKLLLGLNCREPLLSEACSWGRGQFGNPEEGGRPPLEAATEQQLGKTEKTLCVLGLQ
jgi:hypothetical protein